MQQGFFRASDMVIHDHHAGKKQNIRSGFSVFLSVVTYASGGGSLQKSAEGPDDFD